MNKTMLTLLACAGSLGAMVLLANPADAAHVVGQPIKSEMSLSTAQVVNLNVANPMLNLTAQESNPILDQLGCSCATCKTALSQP